MRCPVVTPAIGPSGLFSVVVFRIAQRLILKPAVDRNRRSHADSESIARIHGGDRPAIQVTLRHVRILFIGRGRMLLPYPAEIKEQSFCFPALNEGRSSLASWAVGCNIAAVLGAGCDSPPAVIARERLPKAGSADPVKLRGRRYSPDEREWTGRHLPAPAAIALGPFWTTGGST